jgi:hypothetical protein
MDRVISVEGTDLFGMSAQKDTSLSDGDFDVEIADSTIDVSDHSSKYDDVDLTALIPCTNKQLISSMSSPIRRSPGAARTDGLETRSLSGGNQYRASEAGARTPDRSSKERPRYTTADALRKSVGRMIL